MTKLFLKRNFHLILSSIIVISAAIVYGFCPNLFLNVAINTADEANILKAIMGLYLAFSSLWILAIFDQNFWKTATISNILFMIGLGFGRIIAIIIDGTPSPIFVFGTVGELVLGIYAYCQLKSINK